MIYDPQFPELVKLLRDRGWTETDAALFAPHGTIWVELEVNWPASIADFHEIILRRWERISNAEPISGHEIDRQNSVSDTSGLLECLSHIIGDNTEHNSSD